MADESEPTVGIACLKGCGVPVQVPLSLLKEASDSGRAFEARHELCPGEGENFRYFRIEIRVMERVGHVDDEEVWADLGLVGSGVVQDKSLEMAMPVLTERLNEVWTTKVTKLSPMVDAMPPTLEEELNRRDLEEAAEK